MKGYNPAAEAANWRAKAAELRARAEQAARRSEAYHRAASDPAAIEAGRQAEADRDRAEHPTRHAVFPWKPPAAWIRQAFLHRAEELGREARALRISARRFRQIAREIEADPGEPIDPAGPPPPLPPAPA